METLIFKIREIRVLFDEQKDGSEVEDCLSHLKNRRLISALCQMFCDSTTRKINLGKRLKSSEINESLKIEFEIQLQRG